MVSQGHQQCHVSLHRLEVIRDQESKLSLIFRQNRWNDLEGGNGRQTWHNSMSHISPFIGGLL